MVDPRIEETFNGLPFLFSEKPCFSEMIQLFTCFGKKDFETTGCPKEVAELNTCWSQHVVSRYHGVFERGRALNFKPEYVEFIGQDPHYRFDSFQASTRAKKKMSREDMPIAGQTARELTVRQVNSMLKKWPVGHLIKNAKRV